MAKNISPFIANYERKLKMGVDIRKKKRVERAIEFVERIKRIQKEVEIVLKKIQEKMKR